MKTQTLSEQIKYWRDACLTKLASEESTPFGEGTLVYKVAGKMFALLRLGDELSINLKCDPQEALILRDTFHEVIPGYHMNKKHWNTVSLTSDLDPELIKGWIDDSYDLVVKSLTKKQQAALKGR
ncbi:MmcQ/YjbR family DNA-binding protein [Reinekea marinisedimentorum]|uniref:Putative DNA-binding protein (MmcQ/YjbR family) n=1 Tax=Reinekea marinisedimentorum TaxID=230495 RepID=A0A4R3IEF8_9GAMM|nr:MmcQ/YjbR family DNA-binding protein [Reinekea marinisedimentorum]TCS43171.1 putative DNA-binding protein (MmcQ/YjbR family) [Reinekea marinisedimentorum]